MLPSSYLLLSSLLLLSAASVQNSRPTCLQRNHRTTFPVLLKLRGGECSSKEEQDDQDGEVVGSNSKERDKNRGVSKRSGGDSSDSLGFDVPSESAGSAPEQSDKDGSNDDESAGGLLSPHSYSSASDLGDLGDNPNFVRDVLDSEDLDPDLARFGWDGRLYAYPGQIVVPDDTWPSLKAIEGFNTSSHYKVRDPAPRTPYPKPQTASHKPQATNRKPQATNHKPQTNKNPQSETLKILQV